MPKIDILNNDLIPLEKWNNNNFEKIINSQDKWWLSSKHSQKTILIAMEKDIE